MPVSSDASDPLLTSAQSPDSLPIPGGSVSPPPAPPPGAPGSTDGTIGTGTGGSGSGATGAPGLGQPPGATNPNQPGGGAAGGGSGSTGSGPNGNPTTDQLVNYIYRSLGSPIVNVTESKQQILDAINDALLLVSIYRPTIKIGNLSMTRGVYAYLQGANVGMGIAQVDFVEPNPVPTEIFYGNLINPAPLFRTGLDEYDTFLRWRKVWQRVTSVQPQWYYDDSTKTLYIHNPIERYQAGIQMYVAHTDLSTLDPTSYQWVKEWSLEQARYTWGEQLAMYSGAVPGPVQSLTLDQNKRQNAQARMDTLRQRLFNMQLFAPIMID